MGKTRGAQGDEALALLAVAVFARGPVEGGEGHWERRGQAGVLEGGGELAARGRGAGGAKRVMIGVQVKHCGGAFAELAQVDRLVVVRGVS